MNTGRPRRATRAGLLLAVLAVLAATLTAAPAQAAVALAPESPVLAQAAPGDEVKWSVVPSSRTGPSGRSRFEYSLKPTEEIADWVAVSNLGTKPLKVDIYPTDALNAPDGGFALLLANQQPKDVGAWITMPVKRYTVPVGKRVDIPFRLKIPANAEPGDHTGGIVASASEVATNAEGQQVNVERRVAARVYLRVDGPAQPVAQITAVEVEYANPVQPFGGSDLTVTYRVANLGNVRFSGTARIVVKGPLGVRVGNSDAIDIPELLPDSEIRITRTVSGVFPAGRLTADVIVNPQRDNEPLPSMSRSHSLWAPPWFILALIGAAVGVLMLRLAMRRRARRLADLPGFEDVPAVPSTARGVLVAAAAVAALAAPAEPAPATIGVQVSVGPAASSPAPSPSPTPSDPDDDDLPNTGLAIGAVVAAGAVLVGGGAGLRLLSRRRSA